MGRGKNLLPHTNLLGFAGIGVDNELENRHFANSFNRAINSHVE